MLKIRKYIEGEVIESPIMGTGSNPVTDLVKTQINQAMANSQTSASHYEINNLHMKDHIETGVLYKSLNENIEVAKIGPRLLKMPLLSDTRETVEVLTSPMVIIVSSSRVLLGVDVPSSRDSFNPYTNVFSSLSRSNFHDLNRNTVTYNIPAVCPGSAIDDKLYELFRNGEYKALDVFIDWIVSNPNNDLDLNRSFSVNGYERLISNALEHKLVTPDELNAAMSYAQEKLNSMYLDDSRLSREYDTMLIIHSAITKYAPKIASQFIVSSYRYSHHVSTSTTIREVKRITEQVIASQE